MPKEGMTGVTLRTDVAQLLRSRAQAAGLGLNDFITNKLLGPSLNHGEDGPGTVPAEVTTTILTPIPQQNLIQPQNPNQPIFGEAFSAEKGSLVRPPGFGPGFSPWQGDERRVDWVGFEVWMLREYKPLRIARNKYNYARKFAHCLLQRDLAELRLLTDDKRCHVLKALSALSKFLGVHQEFKTMVKNYGLKWGGTSADDIIIARLTKPKTSTEMYDWLRTVKQRIPRSATFMDFMATTGLRYIEAFNSWNLIIDLAKKGRLDEYYVKKREVLEHFRFKELFIRPSKKAFISFVPGEMVDRIASSELLRVNCLPSGVRKRGLKQRFGDIREFQGSLLTRSLSEPEINFIHGRVSTSVFMTNYFNPAWIRDLKARTLKAAGEIVKKIS